MLLRIAMTSPPSVSTPTVTAAAIARPRWWRRAAPIATAMLTRINAAYAARPTVSVAVVAALATVTMCMPGAYGAGRDGKVLGVRGSRHALKSASSQVEVRV